MVEVVRVCKDFGRHPVLIDVDLEIAAGETVAIVGPSGSGKTTLLRCLNGLEQIGAGKIVIAGETLQDRTSARSSGLARGKSLAAIRRRIGIVFQQYNLFPHLSALDNITLAQKAVLKRPRAEAVERGLSLLKKVGLEAKAHSRPSQLSGGQQQRVAIARALAMDPALLLLDEITSALDPQMTGEVLRVVQQLADDGMTMVVVTHEMGFARHAAHRVVFMADGQVVESGSAKQVLDSPNMAATQAFLSSVLTAES